MTLLSHAVANKKEPMKNLYDSQSVHFALGTLLEPRSVTELRVLHTRNGTISGYFSDLHKLAEAAQQASGMGPGIYVVLNPIAPELLARAEGLAFYLAFAENDSARSEIRAPHSRTAAFLAAFARRALFRRLPE